MSAKLHYIKVENLTYDMLTVQGISKARKCLIFTLKRALFESSTLSFTESPAAQIHDQLLHLVTSIQYDIRIQK